MTNRTWVPGTVGSWFDAANWQPNGAPEAGETLTVTSGQPTIEAGDPAVEDETIIFAGPVIFDLTSANFEPNGDGGVTVIAQGHSGSPVDATILSHGTTNFQGEILVQAHNGSLTIDSESDGSSANFVLNPEGSGKALILVTQESLLTFTGEDFTNNGTVQIEGVARIEAGADLSGTGLIVIDDGGRLVVEGGIGAGQNVVFADGKGSLVIEDAGSFQASIGLTQYGGNRIDIADVRARSDSFEDGVLTLYSGRNQNGHVVAQIDVQLVDPNAFFVPLPPDQQTLTAKDFALSRDGHGGTLITYTPQGPTFTEASLPVPVVAEAGTTVALTTIFTQSFGTDQPGFYSITLLPTSPSRLDKTEDFWGQPQVNGIEAVKTEWLLNGQPITTATEITQEQWANVELRVGNNIGFPVGLEAQVTPAATGNEAEYVDYSVWTVDPAVVALAQELGTTFGQPTPQDMIIAAAAYEAVYGNPLNTDLCNWIADDLGAAIGATMPALDASVDPELNVSGGFWRVVYRGSDGEDPVQDWSTLVQPGDVVRMEWIKTSGGHTTTIVGIGENTDGSLNVTVYDNEDQVAGETSTVIGFHDEVNYWDNTNPAGITIYRLDPNHQYLQTGTDLGELIQGTVFDDLMRGLRGDDILTGSIGDDELVGGRGKDFLTGGDGDDSFTYISIKDSKKGGDHRDVITDFTHGSDLIDLSAIDAIKGGGHGFHFAWRYGTLDVLEQWNSANSDAFHFIGTDHFTGQAGELNYLVRDGALIVQGDTNGDAKADFQIEVHGVGALYADDFIL